LHDDGGVECEHGLKGYDECTSWLVCEYDEHDDDAALELVGPVFGQLQQEVVLAAS